MFSSPVSVIFCAFVSQLHSLGQGFLLHALWREGTREDPGGPEKHQDASQCCITM
jgi:hypothetical protein